MYQGVERTLWEFGGAPFDVNAPIISERDALVRVFVSPRPAFQSRRLRAVLTIDNGGDQQTLDEVLQINGPSFDSDPDSTFNFFLSGSDLQLTTELRVEVFEADNGAPGNGNAQDVVFDSAADLGGLPVEPGEDITLVIWPIQYQFDGSNRLPDTGFRPDQWDRRPHAGDVPDPLDRRRGSRTLRLGRRSRPQRSGAGKRSWTL